MTHVQYSPGITDSSREGMRPVNLHTDLAPLADLMEVVFAGSMDDNGRSAIQEMRYLSKLGIGLKVFSRFSEMTAGISLGYVWVEDDKLVGNVSVYPARVPKDKGSIWVVVNVGVHPDYQRRGIARRLMQASMDMIRERGGKQAVLQTDYDNDAARRLYLEMGFVEERYWTTWKRSSLTAKPRPLPEHQIYITYASRNEWQREYALAERVRPADQGGIGWMKPLHQSYFHQPFWRQMLNWMSMNSNRRLIVRSEDGSRILASLKIEHRLGLSTRLTLMADPAYGDSYAEALLHNTLNLFNNTSLVIEHPGDEQPINDLLKRYRFREQRTVWHMRWDVT